VTLAIVEIEQRLTHQQADLLEVELLFLTFLRGVREKGGETASFLSVHEIVN
jgi:hypothetical protein